MSIPDNDVLVTQPFTGAVQRTQHDKNAEFISVKDFGAVGDGTTDDTSAIQAALTASKGRKVFLPAGVYKCSQTLVVPAGTTLYGEGAGAWRAGPFQSMVDFYAQQVGSTLLFAGIGATTHTLDFVTESRQCGYDRTNPSASRKYNNDYDAEFLLSDFTNKDASFANPASPTRATLKPFSCAVVMGSGQAGDWLPTKLQSLRIVTSCPGDGETYGVKGYGDITQFLSWASWDVGVWAKSPWRCQLEDCQVVGYWGIRGVLVTSMQMDGGTTLNALGNSEFFKISGGIIQSGLSFRGGDVWPILNTETPTDGKLYVEWTNSHRFESSGSLRTSDGTVTYTGLEYVATPNFYGKPMLAFTGCSNLSGINFASKQVIELSDTLGFANSTINNCEITDFSHSTRVEEQSNSFPASRRRPFRAAVEISGHPARGFTFNDVSVFGSGPVMFHFGAARDVELYSCYCEPKGYKMSLSGSSQDRGAAFIAGPKAAYAGILNHYYVGTVSTFGVDFTGYVNRDPLVKCSGRLATMTDVFNPRGFFSQDLNLPMDGLNTVLAANNGQSLKLMSRSTGGVERTVFTADTAGAVAVDGQSVDLITRSAAGSIRNVFSADTDGNVSIGPSFSGNVTSLTAGYQRISNEYCRLQLEKTNLAANNKVWEINNASDGAFEVRTATDTYFHTGANVAWSVARSGLTVSGQSWTVNSGEFSFGGGNIVPQTDNAVALGKSTAKWSNIYSKNISLYPASSVTPADNGQMTFELTSNTQLKVKVKGSDGVVRSATLTLA